MKIIFRCACFIIVLCGIFHNTTARALSVASFEEVNLQNVRYMDRICLSTDINNAAFSATTSPDIDHNGVIDVLETQTFGVEGERCMLYVGNRSSRYNLTNVLLWIGVDGAYDQLMVNEYAVAAADAVSADDPHIVWPDAALKSCVDQVVLLNLEQSVNKRTSTTAPVSSCIPAVVSISSVVSSDPALRLYVGAFGAVQSGYTSYTAPDADVVFKPTLVVPTTTPVPEPSGAACLVIAGILGRFLNKRRQ